MSAGTGPASPADAPITLGLDLGTSAVKVAAVDLAASRLAETEAPFETLSSLPGQAEQDPADWLAALRSALRALDARLTPICGSQWRARIGAIGLTGQLPTLVCLAGGRPIGRAITWKDSRADAWASAQLSEATRRRLYERTGMPLDGRYLAPMLRVHFADRLGSIERVLSAKDFVLQALTGLELTDPSTAAGYALYDIVAGRFSEELAAFWGVPLELLPRVGAASSIAGPLSAAGAALLDLPAGTPVALGAADSVSAAFAMSGLDEGRVSISFGTSAVIVGSSRRATFDPRARYLLTPHVLAGWFGREMDLLATGSGHRWLSALFGWHGDELDRAAAGSKPGAQGLLFPPYLAGGEQGALWNPRLVASLSGLNLRHGRADIARAFLEGACYEVRRCIEVLAESTPIGSVRVSGPIVQTPTTLQLLADILDRPVTASPDRSPAAVGAALLAQSAAGLASDPGAGAGVGAGGAGSPLRPERGTARLYNALYRDYLERASRCI